MFRDLFANIASGRLDRARFAWAATVLIANQLLVTAIGVVFALGVAGDDGNHVLFSESGAKAVIYVIGALFLTLYFAILNVTAKRARDIGWPGWLVAFSVMFASFGLGTLLGAAVSYYGYLMVWAVIGFMPSKPDQEPQTGVEI